jgi:hypothetical protein
MAEEESFSAFALTVSSEAARWLSPLDRYLRQREQRAQYSKVI